MKNIEVYNSTGEWFRDAKQEGYFIPLALPAGIKVAMQELNKTFPEIFNLFLREKIIVQEGNIFIYNMQGHKALKQTP